VTATEQTRRPRYAGRAQHLAQAAHRAADHGMAVFPIVPGTKYPAVKEDWQQQATTNHDQITATWRRAPFNLLTGLRDDTPLWIGGPGELGL
jgi:hypothetical protein